MKDDKSMIKVKTKALSGYFPTNDPAENTLIQRSAQRDAFFYIQIFGGNSPADLDKSRQVKVNLEQQQTKRPIVFFAEMDVCWAENSLGQCVLYSYHPSRRRYRHPLSYDEVVEKECQGECHYVPDLLERGKEINYFFDLKTGVGSLSNALSSLLTLLGEKANNCLFYSYDPLLLAELFKLNPNLALSVRTMKQWINGKSILVPRVCAAGSVINVYDLPVGAITINVKFHRHEHLRKLNDHVRKHDRYLIFGTLGRSKQKFKLAYDLGLGANINKLSYDEVREFL